MTAESARSVESLECVPYIHTYIHVCLDIRRPTFVRVDERRTCVAMAASVSAFGFNNFSAPTDFGLTRRVTILFYTKFT